MRTVTVPSQASHARSTSGGISATPASTIREVPAGICKPSASTRLRLFIPHDCSFRSTPLSSLPSASQRSASTVSPSFRAAVDRSSPFSCNACRSRIISCASPPAQFVPSPGGSGNSASYSDQSATFSKTSTHATRSTQSAAASASRDCKNDPGVTTLGASSAPADSASASRKRRPLCAVGTTTSMPGSSSRRSNSHATACVKNGRSHPRNSRSIIAASITRRLCRGN